MMLTMLKRATNPNGKAGILKLGAIYTVLGAFAFVLLLSLTSCDLLTKSEDEDEEKPNLYVKFTNSSESEFTITTIELQQMGVAGEESTPSGVWSDNILTNGKRLAPGEYAYFNLEIENQHWCQYRLGADDGQGNEVMLHEQSGDYGFDELPITHWGSDERTVLVTLKFNESTGNITVVQWSDFAGIDE